MSQIATKTAFAKYPVYKDSGVEWLGDIPEHWEANRIASFFNERKRKVTDFIYQPLSVTKNGVLKQLGYVAKSKDGENRKLVKEGDFVINSRSDRKGSSGLSRFNGSVSLINIVLKPKNIVGDYINYLFKSNSFVEENYRIGHGIVSDLWTTRYDEMKNIKITIPPISEQTAIAQFLDEKSTKIDQAIAQKEKMIELLKERKQIIIQNAVTKGLDANVKMKDSGVEWIGEIPEHWEVKRLKYVLKIKNGQEYKHVVSKEGFPVIGSGGAFAFANDYLYDGEALLLGRKGTIDKPLYVNEKFWTVDTMFYAIANNGYSTRYLYFLALTIPFKFYSTSTALPSMTQDDLNNHKIAVPDLKEQIEILNFLDIELRKLDRSTTLQQTQIEKLKEYKATLIDSAVTGKVKVC
jgi:type I restriction enzyme S subunit